MPTQKTQNPQPAQTRAQGVLQQTRAGDDKPPFHFLDLRMIFPILFIIVLLFFGFGVYSYYKSTAAPAEYEERSEIPQLGRPAAEPQVTALTAWTLAVENADPAICIQLRTAEADECLRALAFTFQNPEVCTGIIDLETNAKCIYDIAQSQLKTDYCFRIGLRNGEHSQNSCIYNLAKTRSMPVLCDFIAAGQEPYTQEACKAAAQDAAADS